MPEYSMPELVYRQRRLVAALQTRALDHVKAPHLSREYSMALSVAVDKLATLIAHTPRQKNCPRGPNEACSDCPKEGL